MQDFKYLPLVAILRGITPDKITDVAKGLIDIGYEIIEVPLNSPNAFKSIEILSSICKMQDKDMLYGAGSVLTKNDVFTLRNIGANLIVTPNCNKSVIKASYKLNFTSFIGCMSPSECFKALKYKANAIKIFPSSNLGTTYIKNIKEVLPKETKIFAVGGINKDNMQEYLDEGVKGFGLGGCLYKANKSIASVLDDARVLFKLYNEYKK